MKPKTIKQLQEEIERFAKKMEICSVARDLDNIYREDSNAKATLKARQEDWKAVGEIEFTNILRKYKCNKPNDCMDEIKDKIVKEVFE